MADLKKFLVRRLITFIPTLIGATFLVFLVAVVVPADPARLWAGGEKADPRVVELLRKEYHLDEPIWVQYYYFMVNLITNRMVSPVTHENVWSTILERLPVTLQLALFSFTLVVAVGVPLGIIAALKRDTIVDYLIRAFAAIGMSMPIFWFAYILIFVFYTNLGWTTLAGNPTPAKTITGLPILDAILLGDWRTVCQIVERFWLPSLVLAWPSIGFVARLVRNSFLDAMSADFVEYIIARGLPKTTLYKHVLRNALVPVVTVLGLIFGGLLAGAPITETIFALPGIGMLMIQSIQNYDYLTLIGGVFFIGLIYLTINLVVDILYAIIDPRIRY
ncbi:MAG TPA: ABC transporter permease [Pyrodictium sp.]|nr:ABC transporter permease [Pyrodictium sp.]